MAMNSLQDQSVLVLGLGLSGLAMARWAARCGARVTVADTRAQPPQRSALQAQVPDASFVAGPFVPQLVQANDVRAVFVSPGLTPAETAPVLDAARAQGLWCTGELGLFAHAMAQLEAKQAYAPHVLAVTGTNGKTTVTALTGELVARAGKTVAVAGNIGPSLLDTLAAALDAGVLPEVWVLELSSFQLAQAGGFEPGAATVLNLTQDHLDWHGDMAAYAAAKARVFGRGATMVLNREDPAVMAMRPPPAKRGKGELARQVLSFGAGLPMQPGDFGIERAGGMSWLVRAHDADETQKRKREAEVPELLLQRLMPTDALRIRGLHNALNAQAALALAGCAGCALAPMLHGLREYRGEPHRVEPVAVIQGVEYFDDSKGTNVGATVAALAGLGADRRVVAILGGDGKGQDFSPLAAPVARHARAVVLIGRDAPQIEAALASTGVPLLHATDMTDAVRQSAAQSRSGDAVLLSPACASFDMFDNYGHRAAVFCEAVAALVDTRTEGAA